MKKICVIFLCLFVCVRTYRVLGVFPHTGKSHHIVFEPLLRALAEMGHEVTVVSHYPLKDPPSTYKDVSIAGSMHLNVHICDFDDFLFLSGVGPILRHIMATYELFDLGNLNCNAMTNHKNVQELMSSNENFDVIITEQFNSDCAYGVIHKFKAPVVGIATHVPMPWTRGRFGMAENPSYVPNHFLRHLRHPSFFDTVESLLVDVYYKMVYYINTHVLEYRFLGKGFLDSRRDLDVIANNMSLLLVTTYFPLHGALPQGPNVIDIGGIHLSKTLKQLESDISEFIEQSTKGVIYFSMGSMIRGKSLPLDKMKAFQEAFKQLPFRVLWKWENDTMDGKPDNVMIKPWLPQYEILSHVKVKAFISHGGLLGLTEAVHRGVPVLIIPFFGDQFVNGVAAEESGLGKVLQYEDITTESVVRALKQLLDPKMQESAKKISAIWNDRPASPLETAVFWIEHVARYGGKHLRPVSADLPLYRYLLLDVIAFIILLSTVFIIFMNVCVRRCCSRKSSKKKTE